MARKKKHEEHVNHERWLVSYADFITLLFATFTALFAISNADKDKFKKLAESLRNAFDHNGTAPVVDVRKDLLKGMQNPSATVAFSIAAAHKTDKAEGDPEETGGGPEMPMEINNNPSHTEDEPSWDEAAGEGDAEAQPTPEPTPQAQPGETPGETPEEASGITAVPTPTPEPKPTSSGDLPGDKGGEGNADAQMTAQIKDMLDDAGLEGKVDVHQEARGMVISMNEAGFFGSGSVDILPASRHQLDKIINVLRQKQFEVRIEGHTDNTPVGAGNLYKSNLELSTMRASRIAQFMMSEYRYPAELVSAAGYGDSRPVADNNDIEGRQKNRRVDIVILNDKERATEPRPQG